MATEIRRITNGKEEFYLVIKWGFFPAKQVTLYRSLEKVPKNIRIYIKNTEPEYFGPGRAAYFGIQRTLYPGFPKCKCPQYFGTPCIAESCQLCAGDEWKNCPFFSGYKV